MTVESEGVSSGSARLNTRTGWLERIGNGPLGVLLLTVFLVAAAHWAQRDLFVGLADEGYLWYGTWRTSLGEIPLRDFQSYDPGRYYWGALFAQVFGDGLFALRASNALFAWVGLSCAALVLRRLDRDLLFVLVGSLVLFLWMYPRHKLFEPSVAMILTLAVVSVLDRPSLRRHFTLGVVVGLIACVGRNHGAYGLVALVLAIGLAWWRSGRSTLPAKEIFVAGAGVLLGYLPVLMMLVFVPGFFEAFLESALVLVRAGTTNLSRPIPWLWDVLADPASFGRLEGTEGFSLALVAVMYTAWPIAVGTILVLAIVRRSDESRAFVVLISGAVVALPYFHFATSRAGLSHLAQAASPLLIVAIAAPYVLAIRSPRVLGHASRARGIGLAWCGLLLAVSLGALGQVTPLAISRELGDDNLVWQDVAGARVRMVRSSALVFETLARLRDDVLEPDDEILVVPVMPTFYMALDRQAPGREIWFTLPSPAEVQRQLIADLDAKQLRFVIHCDVALDGNDAWRFRQSHALLWGYIEEKFVPIDEGWLGYGCTLFERSPGRARAAARSSPVAAG